ncbi:EAL domain-containing protein [Psychrosphaera sp. B3R10]|uniref:EAL domain-containing protein n=1 Tax=unclassified Psychrosphaera TaxID=2641570 RepID=UPI001C09A9FE|nr:MULTISPECIES: EAL domain-containing protein [unclassified Psychrosphaera]MBU2882712.1 EAL domain-containing protein [Psychrosphaera sp. I2R16]MBU2989269.1 EAL domain-containing protein [Psychrosphaera sp. B3R10]
MQLSRTIYRSLMRSAIVLVFSIFLLFNIVIIVDGESDLAEQVQAQSTFLANLTPSEIKSAPALFDTILAWRLTDDYGEVLATKSVDFSWYPENIEFESDYGTIYLSHESLLAAILFELALANSVLLVLLMINLASSHRNVYGAWHVFMQLEAWANRYTKSGDFRFFVKNTDYNLVNTVRTLHQNKQDAQQGGNKVDHSIRSQTFLDNATGLGNRLYFEQRLESLLQQEDEAYGAVLIVQFGALDDFEDDEGEFDLLLSQYSGILKQYVDDTQQSLVSRISHSDFAILLPFVDIKEVERVAMNILRMGQKIELPEKYDKNAICHIGADLFTVRDSSFQILAEADMALRAAQLHGPSGWFVYETDSLPQSDVKGSVRWRTAIENAITNNKFKLYFQPVSDYDRHVHHFEVFVRMEDDKQGLINAQVFLPMARKSGLIPEVDKQMLTLLIETLKTDVTHMISVNIHIDSWLNRKFVNWLISFVKANRNVIDHIIFEISEFELAQNAKKLTTIFAALNRYNARIMVDQVGLYVLDTSYVNYIKLDYVKLHQSIVNNIHDRPENQMFIRSLLAITNQKSLTMFAVGVEKHEEIRVLQRLGISGIQGHYVSSPLLQLPKSNQMLKFSGDKLNH